MPLPAGFVLVEGTVGPDGDQHAAGRRAAAEAIAAVHPDATLAYDGPRPIAVAPDGVCIAVSITHTRSCVLAMAAPVRQLGIDLVDDVDADRIARIGPRFFAGDTPADLAAAEAALKARGLGLLDLVSGPLQPHNLSIVLERYGDRTLAVAFTSSNESRLVLAIH